jgi:hypothetical protein
MDRMEYTVQLLETLALERNELHDLFINKERELNGFYQLKILQHPSDRD